MSPPWSGVVEQRAQPVLLLGCGERHARDAGGERRDLAEPVDVELEQVVGVVAGAGERLHRVEQEA